MWKSKKIVETQMFLETFLESSMKFTALIYEIELNRSKSRSGVVARTCGLKEHISTHYLCCTVHFTESLKDS